MKETNRQRSALPRGGGRGGRVGVYDFEHLYRKLGMLWFMWSCCCDHNVKTDPNQIVCLSYVRDCSAPNVCDRRSYLTWVPRILGHPWVVYKTSTILEYLKFDKYGECTTVRNAQFTLVAPLLGGVLAYTLHLWGGASKIRGQDMMILFCASCWYWCWIDWQLGTSPAPVTTIRHSMIFSFYHCNRRHVSWALSTYNLDHWIELVILSFD